MVALCPRVTVKLQDAAKSGVMVVPLVSVSISATAPASAVIMPANVAVPSAVMVAVVTLVPDV